MSSGTRMLTLGAVLIASLTAHSGTSEPLLNWRAQQAPTGQEAKPQASEIRSLFEEDQRDRENMLRVTPEELGAINRRDAQRRQRTRELLAADALNTGEEYRFAAFIFQHGDTPDDILMAHVLAVVALARGDERSRGIAAATLDRYLHRIQQPQVFGTQYTTGQMATPEARTWTQEPFNRELLPPTLRRGMCVPDARQQEEMLDALNKGTPVQPPRVCP